jgi:hypothetical protein
MTESSSPNQLWDCLALLSERCDVSIDTHGGPDGRRVWQVTARAPGRQVRIEGLSLMEAIIGAVDESIAQGLIHAPPSPLIRPQTPVVPGVEEA